MNLSSGQQLKIASQCVAAEYAGGLAIFDARINEFFMLNEVGQIVWDAVSAGLPVEDAIAKILEEYEAEAAQVRTDVDKVIEDLKQNGLLELV